MSVAENIFLTGAKVKKFASFRACIAPKVLETFEILRIEFVDILKEIVHLFYLLTTHREGSPVCKNYYEETKA